MTIEARGIVAREPDAEALAAAAVAGGYRTLREDGIRKAVAGLTSLEELHRVT
jgi:general secretion pathway protein E